MKEVYVKSSKQRVTLQLAASIFQNLKIHIEDSQKRLLKMMKETFNLKMGY